jgi:DEAD/DEAH box helicase domain-containing protein
VRPLQLTSSLNFEIWSDVDEVFSINDNDGRLFEFRKLNQGETWATTEALQRAGANPPISTATASDPRALASIKPTDVLVLGISSWPVGVIARPTGQVGLATRAALFSLGFLVRRAAADLLDIDERELKVGLRLSQDANGNAEGQIFLSDSLENGAGYSTYFGEATRMRSLLEYVTGTTRPEFYRPYTTPPHADDCVTSCPDCLRDFTNLAYHNILDWRLGLDLARLALDANAPIDFSVEYWHGVQTRLAPPYFNALVGWHAVQYGGLPAVRRDDVVRIVTHPLWDSNLNSLGPQLAMAVAEAQADGCNEIETKSVFEIARRPY